MTLLGRGDTDWVMHDDPRSAEVAMWTDALERAGLVARRELKLIDAAARSAIHDHRALKAALRRLNRQVKAMRRIAKRLRAAEEAEAEWRVWRP